MATVHRWTGLEARALRLAMRVSVRAFAEDLGVAVRTVSKWEKLLAATEPRPDTQAILDTALGRADTRVHIRFEANLSGAGRPVAHGETVLRSPRTWEYESWADDLDRVVVALARQDFVFADRLLHRWLDRFTPAEADDHGAYLYARSMVMLGDLQRDKGSLLGPSSALHCYHLARDLYSGLDLTRRLGQTDLLLALIDEMTGRFEKCGREYERLAGDRRLSARDHVRALLWRGRTLSKLGDHDSAIKVMTTAAHGFEDLEEPLDWSVTQQKIALAHRGSGDLRKAIRHIDIARSVGGAGGDAPLQRVRLGAAYAHVLLSDPATRREGVAELQAAADTAGRYGLGHQLRSIERVRRSCAIPPVRADSGEGESGSASAGAWTREDHG